MSGESEVVSGQWSVVGCPWSLGVCNAGARPLWREELFGALPARSDWFWEY